MEVHAYVLMPNHFHLLVRTRQANLSRAMQWLAVTYSIVFNRKHGRCGHLFQGRFKSFIVEDEKYFTAMGLYIHGNPLRARLADDLAHYPWSSYLGYIDYRKKEPWLTTELIISLHDGKAKELMKAQNLYLAEGNKILEELHRSAYLGSMDYAEACLKKLAEKNMEKPQVRHLAKSGGVKRRAERILRQLGEEQPDRIFGSTKRKKNPLRDFVISVLYKSGVFTNREIGEIFGIGYTAVTEAARRAAVHVERDKWLEKIREDVIYKISIDN